MPVASREFSRTERLLIRFRAYGPAGGSPAVSATLLDRVGHAIRALDVTAAPGAGDYTIDLPLAGFAPGDYAIDVKSAGGARRDGSHLLPRHLLNDPLTDPSAISRESIVRHSAHQTMARPACAWISDKSLFRVRQKSGY